MASSHEILADWAGRLNAAVSAARAAGVALNLSLHPRSNMIEEQHLSAPDDTSEAQIAAVVKVRSYATEFNRLRLVAKRERDVELRLVGGLLELPLTIRS